MKRDTVNILKAKPIKIWEIREYKKGSLLENGVVLNETATFIYKLFDGKKTVDEIIKIVFEIYRVNQKRVQTDVIKCVKELLGTGAIKLK